MFGQPRLDFGPKTMDLLLEASVMIGKDKLDERTHFTKEPHGR